MPILLWGVLALAAGLAAIWVAAWQMMPRGEPLPRGLPATALQRISRWSLLAGLLFASGAVVVVVRHGAEVTYDDDAVRLTFTLLVLAGVFVLGGAAIWLGMQARRDPRWLDERDRAIMDRAPAVQGVATLLTLAMWVIALTERFHDAGAVPVFYLTLLFWSCLMVHLLGLPLGILIGYRRR